MERRTMISLPNGFKINLNKINHETQQNKLLKMFEMAVEKTTIIRRKNENKK